MHPSKVAHTCFLRRTSSTSAEAAAKDAGSGDSPTPSKGKSQLNLASIEASRYASPTTRMRQAWLRGSSSLTICHSQQSERVKGEVQVQAAGDSGQQPPTSFRRRVGRCRRKLRPCWGHRVYARLRSTISSRFWNQFCARWRLFRIDGCGQQPGYVVSSAVTDHSARLSRSISGPDPPGTDRTWWEVVHFASRHVDVKSSGYVVNASQTTARATP